MATISVAPAASVNTLNDRIKGLKGDCASLEEAAQRCVSFCYDAFREDLVLIRLFATVEFGKLPPANQVFVRKLAEAKQIGALLTDTTPVLSLLGTRGLQSDWNDRRRSEGHVGIPLVSASFAE